MWFFTANQNMIIILKELAKKLEGEFNCLGETIEKYKTFSVQTTKEGKSIFNNGKETTKIIF